jgi:23S rRNA U2552 (ribose-2'-O)-methylase RlmE/FtsJ
MSILNWKLFLEELVGSENPISNYDDYVEGMQKSIDDKLFFIGKIDFDVIVDFGCANGIFLSKIKQLKPNVKIIGYDLDDNMLEKASLILGDNSLLTSNWNDVVREVSKYKNPLLNLSSVIHEVYSYSHSSVIKKFWETQVFGGNFKFITIRDMIPSVDIHKGEISKYREDIEKVKKVADPYYLNSFEERWGIIDDNYRTFVHFLLKYKYIDNWKREVNENYLPVSLETVKKKIPSSYSIVYEKDFIVPFIEDQIMRDFGIKITHSTHTKLILKNNNFRK